MCRWNTIVGSDGAIWAAPSPAKKFLVAVPLSVVLFESFSSVRTYVRFVCESDHSPALF